MSGAKNCPETPRQRMIGMMYLVLTAMLALNVSTDILNGFTLVGKSIHNQLENANRRNIILYDEMDYLYSQNPTKVQEWLNKSKEVKTESDNLYNLLEDFRWGVIQIADGAEARPDTIQKRDNLDAAGQYAEIALGGRRGNELKEAIEKYRKFVERMFDNDPERTQFYEKLFNTDDGISGHGEMVDWVTATFESMPAVAVVTMIEKYQSDVRSAEADLLTYFTKKTDAGDFRVNKIQAVLIPTSKHVIQGGTYTAEIALMAVDTTKLPEYYLNGNKLDTGIINIRCGSIGTFPLKGHISVRNPAGEEQTYEFADEYTVGAPTATVANVDMNVVYRGYNNKMEISVPGIASEKLRISATGATMTKEGKYYICKPTAQDKVIINISADVEGRVQSMGSSEFRVKPLPSPTAFMKINGNDWRPKDGKIKRNDLLDATVIAQYEDGMLNANFTVTEFTLLVSDGRGGFASSKSAGNKFSESQRSTLSKLKPGVQVVLENIKYTGPKSGTLPFPVVTLP